MKRKLKHASGWVLLGIWFFFGISCAGHQDQQAAMRTLLDVVQAVCPPEITVGDCAYRVEALLDAPKPTADAGAD